MKASLPLLLVEFPPLPWSASATQSDRSALVPRGGVDSLHVIASVLILVFPHLLPQVKLPAEQEDWMKRPAYIKVNNAGVNICENRFVVKF